RYELRMEPDLGSASFAGSQVVDVEVVEPVTEVTLNALDLIVETAEMADADGVAHPATSIEYDAGNERVVLGFAAGLTPGDWQLRTSFTGILNDKLCGFYRSTYKDQDGIEQVIATTQFEAADARRAFPCWDEPDLKATFAVTLVVDEDLVAISNASEVAARPAGDKKVAHEFAETMRMSTYLVAFVVGDFEVSEPVDVDGIPLRVLHTPGKSHLAEFALDAGAFALSYLAEYYDIPYPGDKLDMIGIPDFAWGAMENLGAVTYRESALLVDKKRGTQDEMARVADVISHELAHMWFGDLVTMKWWNGIWLNEAFATFMELKCVDAFRPEWKRWLTFAHFRASSMDVDGLSATRPVEFPVSSPQEANAMFDTLTYGKGAAVMRMLEQYLGEEVFRSGIRRYLKTHSYSNTETDDLWAALEAESGEPVGDIMSGWIYQGGYPQLDVTEIAGGFRLTQRHFRFLGEGEATWQVPALYRVGATEGRVVVGAEPVELKGTDLLLNSGGDGFYRINYPPEMLADLAAELARLEAAERYTLIADAWANVLAGATPAAAFLDLVEALEAEREPDVWGVAVGGLAELGRIASSDDRPALQALVRDLVSGPAAELGWEAKADETSQTKRLRALLLRALGNLGDDVETQATARQVFGQMLEDRDSVDADVAEAVVGIVAANGDEAEFDRFLRLRDSADSPQDEVRYLRAAAAIPEEATARRLVEMVLAGEVRSQDANWLMARLLGHRDTGPLVWGLVKENWDAILDAMPPQNRRRMLDLIMYRSEPDIADDIEAWLAEHPIGGAEKYTEQQMERLRVRVGLREREGARLAESLADPA
ncbi:MAG: M1 family aminopeptidase, partial [Acidimicrobiia bacterium]|nr:M1 family aminopeptidase [Acidimicrobiia bacterium]